jgi:hypothetical protein
MTPYSFGETLAGKPKQINLNGFSAELYKRAMSRGLGDIPVGASPAQMVAALQLLGQARALGTPTTEEVKRKGTSLSGYERSLRRMRKKKRLSDARTNPKLNIILGALLGAAGGAATEGTTSDHKKRLLPGLLGAGLGAGAGAIRAYKVNNDVLATLKVLKDRGVLTPKLFDRAYPVLMTPKD